METVRAITDGCLMQVKLSDLSDMTSKLMKVGGGLTYIEDHQVLMSFFENNYEQKQQWRAVMGIDDRELVSGMTQKEDL